MAFTPGPYSGVSTLSLVARASAFGIGVVYGTVKLSILKVTLPDPMRALGLVLAPELIAAPRGFVVLRERVT
ncbi:hypothetical protein ABZP36_007461 [Zizania latifolia]